MARFAVFSRISLGVLAPIVCSTVLAGDLSSRLTSPLDIKAEFLGEKSIDSPASDKKEDTVSPDGRRVAWRDKRGQQWVVLVNGQQQGAAYDEVKGIIFSLDSKRVAYAARRGNDKVWQVVVDGQEQKDAFGEVTMLDFSADSCRFVYVGQEKNSMAIVVDGKRGPDYKAVLVPVEFSKDSQHYAYAAQQGNKWLIVADGVEGPLYDGIHDLRFLGDGNRFLYVAKRRDAWVVVEDGKEITPESKGGYALLGLTPHEGKLIAVAYEGKRKDRDLRVVIGGQPGPMVDSVAMPIRFGATDDHYVYAAHRVKVPALKANRAFGQIVTDGKEGRQYEAPTESTFSAWMNLAPPSGRILSPAAGVRKRFNPRWDGVSSPAMTEDGSHMALAARREDKEYVVVADGVDGPAFEAVPCGPTYGPDGKLYYTGFQAGKLITVVDEKRVSEYAWKSDKWTDYDGCPAFLVWDGGHWGYMTVEGGGQYHSGQTSRAKRRVIVDGQAGQEYDANALAALQTQNADGEFHFSYEVHENKGSQDASFVVLDGREGRPYDAIFQGSSEFSSGKTVTFVARSGRRFLRVTQSRP